MAKLILVKHSLPEVDRTVPASQWRLGHEGRRRCGMLALALERYRPAGVICSKEPKAEETARLIAAAWGQGYATWPRLHEHRRETVGRLDDEAFEGAVRRLFEAPDALVFGEETAAEARRRFAGAVEPVAAGMDNLIVVAHGTVIALYVAAVAGGDGYTLWRRLGLPSFVVLARPGGEIEAVVERLEARDGAEMG